MAEQKYRWNYAKPREIRGGIRSRSSRGRISAANWWSARWMRILEECIDSGRISRGRSYARKGQVTSIEIEPGLVTAFVQGTRKKPYQIKLGFETVAEKEKELLLLRFREHASFAARLLACEMPEEMELAFMEAGIPLFPKRTEMKRFKCTCPDDATPCKHIVAVLLLIAEVIDDDPFLLLKLRGIDKNRLIAMLTSENDEGENEMDSPEESYEDWDYESEIIGGAEAEEPEEQTELSLDEGWYHAKMPNFHYADDGSQRMHALEVMNDFPFWRGESTFRQTLTPCYERAANKAFEILTGEKKTPVGRPKKLL